MNIKLTAICFVHFLVLSKATLPQLIPSATFIQQPQFDSAIVQSERIGPNFAYSTVEERGYHALSPIVQSGIQPIQIRYQINPVPLALPTAQYIYLQEPVISSESKAEKPKEVEQSNAKDEKIDDDTVSVESA